jgi:hypothetical protein
MTLLCIPPRFQPIGSCRTVTTAVGYFCEKCENFLHLLLISTSPSCSLSLFLDMLYWLPDILTHMIFIFLSSLGPAYWGIFLKQEACS